MTARVVHIVPEPTEQHLYQVANAIASFSSARGVSMPQALAEELARLSFSLHKIPSKSVPQLRIKRA